MAKDIPQALRRAGVPKSCWGRKLEESGLGYITEWAKTIAERNEAKEAKIGIYVRAADGAKAAALVELYARQAVVYGQAVRYLPFSQLSAELNRGPRAMTYEDDTPKPYAQAEVFDVYSVGVLAIPFLPTLANAPVATATEYAMVQDFLISHVFGGGILVLGGSERISAKCQSKYDPLFERTIFDNTEVVEAV